MKYIFTAIITFVLSVQLVSGQVEQATEALKNRQFENAIQQYQTALNKGKSSGELHYNMGLAYAELKQLGYAIWHFELAKKAGLTSSDLAHNIRLVKEQRKDEIEVIPEFFLKKWWNSWRSLFSSNLWSLFALLFLFGGVYGLYTWRMAEDRNRRKLGFAVGLPLILFALLCFASAYDASLVKIKPSQGVLLANTFDLRAAPDYDSAEILTVHEGVYITVNDQIGDWIKVRLENGQVGWLPYKEVGLF